MITTSWQSSACAIAGLLLLALAAGCNNTPSAIGPIPFKPVESSELAGSRRVDPALLKPPAESFTLGPGDRIDIEVLGDVNTRVRNVVVGPDGKIYFYMLPGLDVWGLTLGDAQALIARELQNFVREKPAVSISLREAASQRVWILGRLATPGVYPIAGPMTLLEAISLAGGPVSASSFNSLTNTSGIGSRGATDEAADLDRSFVIRNGRILPVDFNRLLREGDLSHNIYLQPDDFVYMPSAAAADVHVLGAVNQPKTVNYTNRLTLVQAIANAGGTVPGAFLGNVAVVRGSLTQPRMAIVDYDKITKGLEKDVLLEPQDIVYIPYSPYRTLTRYANLVVDTFARAVGANEGSRAVSRDAENVGVSVNVQINQ